MALNFISIPPEQTTAVTDLILAAQSMICLLLVRRTAENQGFSFSLWSWVFGLLCFASLLGTIVHGFELAPETMRTLWRPIYFALGLLVALIALAAISHFGHENISRRLLPAGIGIAFIFFAITQIWSDSFLLFVVYEAIMMMFALALYVRCIGCPIRYRGAGFLAAGVLLTLIAAAVDTQSTLRLQFVWAFDNHGIFHLIQMLGLLIISVGLYRSREPIADVKNGDAKR